MYDFRPHCGHFVYPPISQNPHHRLVLTFTHDFSNLMTSIICNQTFYTQLFPKKYFRSRTILLLWYKSNLKRGMLCENTNFLISWPILTYEGSFYSTQINEQLLFETFFSKTNIYPYGGVYYPKIGQIYVPIRSNKHLLMGKYWF